MCYNLIIHLYHAVLLRLMSSQSIYFKDCLDIRLIKVSTRRRGNQKGQSRETDNTG